MPAIKGTFSRRLLRRIWRAHGYTHVTEVEKDALEAALCEHVETLFDELRRHGLHYWSVQKHYMITLPWRSQAGAQLRFGSEQQKAQIIRLVSDIVLKRDMERMR